MKRTTIYLTFLILLLPFIAQAQLAFENKIFRIIRKESYDKALVYGNTKLARLGTGKKYYKRAIPYYLGIGLVHKKAGNYKEAEKSFYEAYNILNYKQKKKLYIKNVDFDVLDELGLMYLETGNFVEAKDLIETSIRLRKKRFEATNLLRYRPYLAYGNYYYKTGQADSAYFYFQKYLLYIKNSNHTSKQELNRYADTYKMLAELELGRYNLKKGLRFAKQNKKWQFHKWTRKEAGKNNLNKIIALNLLSEAYRLKKDYRSSLT
ncbi:MAG TPA: tetratricopeptide repeat protein, partial [Cytophagaceae bacterium]